MTDKAPAGAKVERLVEAEAVIIGERSIQPVARLVGWEVDGGAEPGSYVGKVGRLSPLEVRVDDGDAQQVIAINDPIQEPIRGILVISALVSAFCLLIMLVANVAAMRK